MAEAEADRQVERSRARSGRSRAPRTTQGKPNAQPAADAARRKCARNAASEVWKERPFTNRRDASSSSFVASSSAPFRETSARGEALGGGVHADPPASARGAVAPRAADPPASARGAAWTGSAPRRCCATASAAAWGAPAGSRRCSGARSRPRPVRRARGPGGPRWRAEGHLDGCLGRLYPGSWPTFREPETPKPFARATG